MDPSKAFECINHGLSIEKLAPYSLKLIRSYLTKRKQRVKVNGSYSTNTNRDITIGERQGLVLEPLLLIFSLWTFSYLIPASVIMPMTPLCMRLRPRNYN